MNLNLLAPITVNTSYGLVATNLLKELTRKGVDIALFPIGQVDGLEEDRQIIQTALDNQARFDTIAASLRIFHQFSLAEHVGVGQHIGFPIFELDKFNPREYHHLRSQDQLFVCSKWAQEICTDHHLTAQVIPLGVDTSIFSPTENPRRPGSTTFLNVGKLEIRKGHDILAEAFGKAFTPKDNVRLKMMWHNFFMTQDEVLEWERLYMESPMGDRIQFLSRVGTQRDLAEVMRSADCGVFPSRAEGWNLELLEMMAVGKPTIATNYSGHTEYANAQNCLLIEVEDVEPAYDGKWFHGEGNWASFGENQMDQLVEHMRTVHKEVQSNPKCGNPVGIETAKRFSWESAANQMLEYLR